MTSPGDAAPVKPLPSFLPGAPIIIPKSKITDKIQPSQPFNPTLGEATISASPTVSFSSGLPLPPSRNTSPNGKISSSTPQLARSSVGSPLGSFQDGPDDVRTIIFRSFSPSIGVYASEDTDELAKQKGFKGGFRELIRPFGEKVPGKVVIRDSVGSSRAWEDYGVLFVELAGSNWQTSASNPRQESPLAQIEEALQRRLDADELSNQWSCIPDGPAGNSTLSSPLYTLFLRRLLSASPPTPHETFRHPVACVIAISSRNTAPLESLRQLYAHTSQGNRRPPAWVNPEFLRYYVLVHDEDRDDISESTKLYDQMKRHFGLHCHLLRLRSNQCVITDDDSIEAPPCEWLSPFEDLRKISEMNPLIDLGPEVPYLFESDITAIRTFVRELVVQSVIPYMENKVALWNDQTSRRRGLSGRFMSMSRRWAGFGSASRSGVSGTASGGVSGNYDVSQGFYKPDTPEAVLRKLADFAFMLRDWKFSASTYELLKTDYGNDKAWKHQAGAHEMCAVSMLLNPLAAPATNKLESIDQMFESSCYSYLTRCSDALSALRSLLLAVELLKSRGGSATEMGAKWAMRITDLGLVGSIGQVLLGERVSACYASKTGVGGAKWGSRRRKAAMWRVLTADSWLKMGKPALASVCLEEAERLYAEVLETDGVFPMPEMQTFIDELKRAVQIEYLETRGIDTRDESAAAEQLGAEETSEKLDHRSNRKSLMGNTAPLEARPPMLRPARNGNESLDDEFE